MISANDQAMAAFLASTAAAYSGIPAVGIPSQNSPLMANTVGITPSQSIQSLQLNDFGSDAASLAVLAASQTQPGALAATTVDMANSIYSNNSFASIDSASFSSMLSAPAQQAVFETAATPGTYNMAQVPATMAPNATAGFLTPSAVSYDQAAAAAAATQTNIELILGKRKFDEAEMGFLTPTIGGVPLSKRVSMPASYGDFQNQAAPAMMPMPAEIGMQRISSYHPGAYVNASPAQGTDIGSSSTALPMAPVRLPISRLKTTPVGSAAATAKGNGSANKRMLGSSTTFSALPQPQPTQHQRKVAHNAIERRYRNNINDRICDLRNSVPALQHVRPKRKPHTASSYARDNGDSSNEDDEDDDDNDNDNDNEGSSNQVDGVEAATKLNKATILGKSTEYIYYLRRTNDLLKRESTYLQDIIRNLPDGQKILDRILQRAKDESAIATVMLKVPERATVPKKKSQQKQ
ncbi:hypothetical protein LPJ56_001394 [Coemansia sp. RSA 2599]|nr:hypothetical protein LPJ56_001394 [Coemansia sp. RSA 2599]